MRAFNGPWTVSPRPVLRALFWLRWFAIGAQLVVILAIAPAMGLRLPVAVLLVAPVVLTAWNLLELWRLQRTPPVTAPGAWLSLMVDLLALTWLLYWSGGHANPFVSLYLVVLALSCVALPVRWTLATTLLAIVAYSLLVEFHQPLSGLAGAAAFDRHLAGMWVNFVLSAVLIVGVGSFLVHSLRTRERALAEARARRRRDQQVLGLAAAVAGAAHELATPLSSAATRDDDALPEPARADVAALDDELTRCRRRLRALLGAARLEAGSEIRRRRICELLQTMAREWRESRPAVRLALEGAAFDDHRVIAADSGLESALHGLLANAMRAAAAAPEPAVVFSAERRGDDLVLEIRDNGAGPAPGLAEQLGISAVRSASGGFGVGLVLADAAIDALGGEVVLERRAGGGTTTRVVLPLARLVLEEPPRADAAAAPLAAT